MQGFLNAIVYGWSRDDFVKSVVTNPTIEASPEPPPEPQEEVSSEEEVENEEEKPLIRSVPAREALRVSGGATASSMINSSEAQTDVDTDNDLHRA